jgi:alpha-L-arabinofuranosidase
MARNFLTPGMHLVTTSLYSISFWYRFPNASQFSGNANVGFQTASGLSLGSVNVALSGSQTSWKQVTTSFRIGQAPVNDNNWFAITLDGTASSGQIVHFAMISVMPPTFNSRANYVRSDLATVSVSLHQGAVTISKLPGTRV